MNEQIDLEQLDQLVRYFSGECSNKEENDIETWLRENPEYKIIIDKLQKVWESKMNRAHSFDVKAAWERLSKEMDREESVEVVHSLKEMSHPQSRDKVIRKYPSTVRNLVRVAAAVIIIGFVALYYMQFTDDAREIVMQEVVTERGERANIQLVDGSNIRLSVDSKLTYPNEFDADNRTVHLDGEAYFEVVGDDRPFVVIINEAEIRVLGTEFNVQSYQDEEHAQIVVAGGKVAVRSVSATNIAETVMQKGDLVQVLRDGNGEMLISHGVELHKYLGWLENRLQFEDTPLMQVVKELERWYNVDIHLKDPELSGLRYTGTFEEESLSEILNSMEYTLQLEVEIDDRTVTLFREGTYGNNNLK